MDKKNVTNIISKLESILGELKSEFSGWVTEDGEAVTNDEAYGKSDSDFGEPVDQGNQGGEKKKMFVSMMRKKFG